MHLSLSAKLGRLPVLFSAPVRDYFSRLDAAGLRVREYDRANARLIDRLVGNGGNFWPDSGAFNAMAGYLYPGNGANLVPLKDGHDAGTLNAFVTGDWDAVTGLKGDGSTKFVDSNRANDADGQDDNHASAFFTQINTAGADRRDVIGSNNSNIRYISMLHSPDRYFTRNNSKSTTSFLARQTGLLAISRSAEADYVFRRHGENATIAEVSTPPFATALSIFGNNTRYSDGRIAIYTLGANLNGAGELAEFDAALTEWKAALANA